MQLRIDRADLGEAVLIIDGPSGALGSSTGSRSASCSAAVAAAIAGMPVAGGTRLMVGSCLKEAFEARRCGWSRKFWAGGGDPCTVSVVGSKWK